MRLYSSFYETALKNDLPRPVIDELVRVFANDVAPVAAGSGRLTVRHTAFAPAVDVRANGAVAFANLANPNEAKADLAAGALSVDGGSGGQGAVDGPAATSLGPGDAVILATFFRPYK
mgnify:CR=1 FL=1